LDKKVLKTKSKESINANTRAWNFNLDRIFANRWNDISSSRSEGKGNMDKMDFCYNDRDSGYTCSDNAFELQI